MRETRLAGVPLPLLLALCLPIAEGAAADSPQEAVARLLEGPGCHFVLDSSWTLGSGGGWELHATGVCKSETTYRYTARVGQGTNTFEFRVLRIAGRVWVWEGEARGWRARADDEPRPPDAVESLLRMLGGVSPLAEPEPRLFAGAATLAYDFRVPVGALRVYRMPVEGEGILHVDPATLLPAGVELSLRTADGGRGVSSVWFSDYGKDVAVVPPGLGASPDELPPPAVTAASLGEACALIPQVRVVARVEAEGLEDAGPAALPAELEVTAMPRRQTAVARFRAAGTVTDEVVAIGATQFSRSSGGGWTVRDEGPGTERPLWQAHLNLLAEVLHERSLEAPERATGESGPMWAYPFDPTTPTASGLLIPRALALAGEAEREVTGRLLLRREDGLPALIELTLAAWPAGGAPLRVREVYEFRYGAGAETDAATTALVAWATGEAERRARVATDLREAAALLADRLSAAPLRQTRVQPLLEEAVAGGGVARGSVLGPDGALVAESGPAPRESEPPSPWQGADEITVSWTGGTATCIAPIRRAGRLHGFLILESPAFGLAAAPGDEDSPPTPEN